MRSLRNFLRTYGKSFDIHAENEIEMKRKRFGDYVLQLGLIDGQKHKRFFHRGLLGDLNTEVNIRRTGFRKALEVSSAAIFHSDDPDFIKDLSCADSELRNHPYLEQLLVHIADRHESAWKSVATAILNRNYATTGIDSFDKPNLEDPILLTNHAAANALYQVIRYRSSDPYFVPVGRILPSSKVDETDIAA